MSLAASTMQVVICQMLQSTSITSQVACSFALTPPAVKRSHGLTVFQRDHATSSPRLVRPALKVVFMALTSPLPALDPSQQPAVPLLPRRLAFPPRPPALRRALHQAHQAATRPHRRLAHLHQARRAVTLLPHRQARLRLAHRRLAPLQRLPPLLLAQLTISRQAGHTAAAGLIMRTAVS